MQPQLATDAHPAMSLQKRLRQLKLLEDREAEIHQAPRNLDAEQALLGAILVFNEAHARVSNFLEPGDFYDPLHQQIYEATAKLITSGQQATPITLRTFFEKHEPIDAGQTVPQYLGWLAANACTIINARDYGRTIHDLAVRRQLILIAEDVRNSAHTAEVDFAPAALIAETTKRLDSLTELSRALSGSLSPMALGAFLDTPIQERKAILEGLIFERNTGMLHAWRGLGKTWVALGLGWAAASGGTFLKWKAPRTHKVMHVCGEVVAQELQTRLTAVTGRNPDRGHMLNYRVLSSDMHEFGIPDLASPEGQAALERVLGDTEFLILDNISTLFRAGVENESESWVPVQNWFLKLRRRGVAILVIHHAGKGGEQRGTSKREDILDFVLSLREPDDYEPTDDARFDIRFEKGRGLTGKQKEPFEAALVIVDGEARWTMREIEESRVADILDMRKQDKSVREIAKALGLSKSAVQRALDKVKEGAQ